VHTLRDTASADAYCALGGRAVSPKVAQFMGERLDLQPWAALVVGGTTRHGSSTRVSAKHDDKLEEKRGELLKVLLKVYMSGGYVYRSFSWVSMLSVD
jgi:vacuolar protein sorting-associated protein 3